MLHRSLGVRWI